MVRLAMIGAGGYAYELIKRILTIPDKIKLVAVSSNPSRQSVGSVECQKRGIRVYPDVSELLANIKGKADVVFVPTPIHTHFALTRLCVESGFEVWLEKPPVATVQELDLLIELSQKHGRAIPVAFQSLYTTILKQLQSRLICGEFGEVLRISSMAGWQRPDSYYSRNAWAGELQLDGEWILDGTINNPLAHLLSNSLYLASKEQGLLAQPAVVEAELYHGHDIKSEDTSSLKITTTEGLNVFFNGSLCAKVETGPITIVECEKARIVYENFNSAVITYTNGRKETILDQSEQRIHMLSSLAESFESSKPYAATVETCRPFTLTVNAAFESCGCIHEIENRFLSISQKDETIETVITGIDHVLNVGHLNGKLFSDIGVEWAIKSKPFDVTGYAHFPTKNFKYESI